MIGTTPRTVKRNFAKSASWKNTKNLKEDKEKKAMNEKTYQIIIESLTETIRSLKVDNILLNSKVERLEKENEEFRKAGTTND